MRGHLRSSRGRTSMPAADTPAEDILVEGAVIDPAEERQLQDMTETKRNWRITRRCRISPRSGALSPRRFRGAWLEPSLPAWQPATARFRARLRFQAWGHRAWR